MASVTRWSEVRPTDFRSEHPSDVIAHAHVLGLSVLANNVSKVPRDPAEKLVTLALAGTPAGTSACGHAWQVTRV